MIGSVDMIMTGFGWSFFIDLLEFISIDSQHA